MFEIGFEEYLYGDGIVVIEWADLIKSILPDENIWITIEKDLKNGVDERIIRVEFNGERYREYEEKLVLEMRDKNENTGFGYIGAGCCRCGDGG